MIDTTGTYIYQWRPHGRENPEYLLEVVTPPSVQPLSYDDVAPYCRIFSTDDVNIVKLVAAGACEYVERHTRLTLLQTVYRVSYDRFDSLHGLRLPRRPVTDATTVSVQYYDAAGTLQTLPTNAYRVDRKLWTTVVPVANTSFPATANQPNSVVITFTAGETADPAAISPLAKSAALNMAIHLYDNRGAFQSGAVVETPFGLASMLSMLGAPEL